MYITCLIALSLLAQQVIKSFRREPWWPSYQSCCSCWGRCSSSWYASVTEYLSRPKRRRRTIDCEACRNVTRDSPAKALQMKSATKNCSSSRTRKTQSRKVIRGKRKSTDNRKAVFVPRTSRVVHIHTYVYIYINNNFVTLIL